MASLDTAKQRRSTRVFARIPVRVKGKDQKGRRLKESGETIVINAHGGLIYLVESPAIGAQIVLINPLTEDEQECRVVYLGDTSEKGQRVGIEFLSPAPHFWGIDFAAPDWPPPPTPGSAPGDVGSPPA